MKGYGAKLILKVGTAALLASLAGGASAAPYVPQTDAVILERVPAAGATRQLEPLRRRLDSRPDDLTTALQLARGYLDIGRETSDPRFVSYAQATLAPWLGWKDPPTTVLVLSATALQYSHRFDAALSLLDRALAREPGNAQAWLTKATVLQVRGEFPAARAACQHLLRIADRLIALTCLASVDSRTGRLERSYGVLQGLYTLQGSAGGEVRSWVLGQLGDMAMRLGDFRAAEAHFKSALATTPGDAYLRAAYADLLLLQRRDREVIALLRGSESQDNLLLRLAIAARRLHTEDAMRWARLYDARRRAARADQNPHLREHARFFLEVRDDAVQALQVAKRNWRVQREPADVRVYLRAAYRTQQFDSEGALKAWLRDTGYEDRTLAAELLAATGHAQ